jgi:hypothetical protein
MGSLIAGAMTPTPMPTNPFDIPRGFGAPTWRKGTPGVPIATPDMVTGQDSLTATELVAQQDWSYQMDEDTIIALMPAMTAELRRSGSEIIDDFVLNADSTAAGGNINTGPGAPVPDAYYLSDGQDGVRHQHLIDNATQTFNGGGAALTDATLVAGMGLLGKYGTAVPGLVFTCDIQTYLTGFLSTAAGAPGNFVMTLEQFGPNALVLTGQLAAYRGIPIIPSPVYRRSLATGLIDGVTPGNNTFGNISIFHRAMWRIGFRRELLIEVARDIQTRTYTMVVSFRLATVARGPRPPTLHTAGIRNIL